MEHLIENFAGQVEEAMAIGKDFKFTGEKRTFKSVVICGLGGSGIGGSFLHDFAYAQVAVPIITVKGYALPAHVDKDTLVIISSYSGNTEETLQCFEEALVRKATICGVSSNGKVKAICEKEGLDCVLIPGGNPPRASFGYSFTQLFYILHYYGLVDNSFESDLNHAIQALNTEKDDIKSKARVLAEHVYEKIPVLYSADNIESITVRWRQQINENGKQLCWHHVVPEMNHNEIVGWREENDKLAVIFLRNDDDHVQVAKRMDLNKVVYQKYTPHIFEVWSKGNSFIERGLYLVNFGDWVSLYLSELRGFDVTEVKVIDELKANLAK